MCTILSGSAYSCIHVSVSLAFISQLLQPGLQTPQRQFHPICWGPQCSHRPVALAFGCCQLFLHLHVSQRLNSTAGLASLKVWKGRCKTGASMQTRPPSSSNLSAESKSAGRRGCMWMLHSVLHSTENNRYLRCFLQSPQFTAWPPDHPLVDCAADLSDLKPQR